MRYFIVMVAGMLLGMLMTASATVDSPSTEEMLHECSLTVQACDDLWEDVLMTPECAEIVAPGASLNR